MLKKVLLLISINLALVASQMPPALVETAPLKLSQINPLSKFIGTVTFENSSSVASQSNGVVTKIYFEVGDKVKKGKTLVRIDSALLDASIESNQANVSIAEHELSDAQKDLTRYEKLLKQDTISQKDYDNVKLKYDVAQQNLLVSKAALKNLKIQKNKKIIKAPLSGTVVSKSANIGEWLNEGKSVTSIVDTESIEIVFNLPFDYVNGLDKTKSYTLNIAQKTLDAKLYAVIPKGDKLTRTFPVKFKANAKDIFVYDGAEATINLAKNSKSEALVIHRDAVIKRFNQNVVFFINDKNIAMMMPVEIVGFDGQDVAIKAAGLVQGMKIVVKGNERVFPNQNVQILNK